MAYAMKERWFKRSFNQFLNEKLFLIQYKDALKRDFQDVYPENLLALRQLSGNTTL